MFVKTFYSSWFSITKLELRRLQKFDPIKKEGGGGFGWLCSAVFFSPNTDILVETWLQPSTIYTILKSPLYFAFHNLKVSLIRMPSLRLVATWSTPPAPSCRRRTRVSSTMFSKSGTSSWWVVFFPGYELVRFILIFYNFHFPGIQFCFKCSIKKQLCVQVLNGFVIKKKQQVYELICWNPFQICRHSWSFFFIWTDFSPYCQTIF